MSIIRMKYPFYDEMAAYAREHFPEEACGLIAVSYTHLDVYKRQTLDCPTVTAMSSVRSSGNMRYR